MYLSLITAIPPKAEEAFRLFRYVPYTSLSTLARVKASRGEDEVILNLSGGISVKLLDQCNEKSISVVEWHAAAHVAKERTQFHHGEAQANTLALHHKVVMDLGRTHSWEVTVEYDIQQHELSLLNPTHDLSSLDAMALTVIVTHTSVQLSHPPTTSPLKHQVMFKATSQPVHKCTCAFCFQCGASGHLPANCKADQMVARRSVAPIAATAQSKHAMLAPSGKPFCFAFVHMSACSYGDSSTIFHSCSICGDTQHGAGCGKSVSGP